MSHNTYEKIRWTSIYRYLIGSEDIDLDSAFRVYRSSPDRVTVQVRGPLRKFNGHDSKYGVIASAQLNAVIERGARERDIPMQRDVCGADTGTDGMAGVFLPDVIRDLPADIILMYDVPDGRFPHHEPNPLDEANLAAHARALVLWHSATLYCGKCGSASQPDASGNVRRCSNADCGTEIFPRTDPAIIVLVADGDRCVLGRQPSWPEGRYSTIAGFVEPGESLEDAVRREVYEETNIRVGAVHYHSSQPWPFPSALMLGFTAEAISDDIVLNDGELEDARWFTREELRSGNVGLPFRISIARRLVDHFINDA